MARKYRKIDPRIWSDERFVRLSEQEKLLALYCLTSPQGNRIGIFRFSIALAAEDLGTSHVTITNRFGHVCHTMRWRFDGTNKVIYFPTWWKYNEPENGSVLRGNLEDLHDVPAGKLVDEFLSNTTFLAASYRVKNGKEWSDQATAEIFQSSRHVLLTMGTRVAHVEAQEQEQEQEQDIPLKSPKGTCALFDEFWRVFPSGRKQGKQAALKAWRAAVKRAPAKTIIAAAAEYASSAVGRGRYVKGPSPWLNQGCWEDDRTAWERSDEQERDGQPQTRYEDIDPV